MKKKILIPYLIMTGRFAILIFCTIIGSSSLLSAKEGYGQGADPGKVFLSLQVESQPLNVVLKSIEKKTEFRFFYDANSFDITQSITLHVRNKSLSDVLFNLSEKAGLEFKQIDNQFSVRPRDNTPDNKILVPATNIMGVKELRFTGSPSVNADEITMSNKGHVPYIISGQKRIYLNKEIRGTVRDTSGSPLPGVSVAVKRNPSIGTSTDLNGKYMVDVPDNAILVYSMVGYESQEVSVSGREIIDIRLEPSNSVLEETVIVAFGSQKKEKVVGAVTTINPEELKTPSSNLTTALAGRVAGIIAYQRSGEPSADNAEFFIRGVTTFGYKSSPLILIDGVEVNTTDLARLPPDDIASFSIMKDATATALYGARGANGVILITTKQGKDGKASYFVRLENSVSAPTKTVELADPITYMKLSNEAAITRDPLNKDGNVLYPPEKIANTVPGSGSYIYPATDWMNELFKDYTMNQRANVNVSGGGSLASYYVSGTFAQDNGILKVPKENNFNNNINLKTYTLRSNVVINLSKLTSLTVRLGGRFGEYTGPINGGAAVYSDALHTNPVRFPAYYKPDKAHAFTKHILFGNYDRGQYNNPYADLVKGYKNSSSFTMNAQLELKQDLSMIAKGLNFNGMINTTRYGFFDVTRSYVPFWYSLIGNDPDNYLLKEINPDGGREYLDYPAGGGTRTLTTSVYMQGVLNYIRDLSDNHTISTTLVYQMTSSMAGNFSSLQASLPYRNLGVSGRATYTFANRYNAEFNFGYNGSERFSANHRYGFFPSVGLSWNVSRESFWDKLADKVNNLKLRATYGLVGNDAIGSAIDRFFYLSEVNMTDGNYGSVFGKDNGYRRDGIFVERFANSNITWEIARMTNIGIEMGLWNKLTIEADFFRQNRTNILMDRASMPANIGMGTILPRANVGAATSSGVDASVDYSQRVNKKLSIQGRANFTYARSKYKKFEEPIYDEEPWLSRIGYSLSQNWGYIAEQLFVDDKHALNSPQQNLGEYKGGDIKYMDVNGDGAITSRDRVPIGYPTSPEIVYGFGISLTYSRLDFSCFFQGLARESFFINPAATSPFQGETQLLKVYADSHWSEEDQDIYALWPRLSSTTNINNTQRSTWWMRDGAFVRLKQLEIGYNFSRDLMKKWKMKNVRFYLNATNLFAISKFKLWDIEMGGNGLGYPVQRVINVGIQTSF